MAPPSIFILLSASLLSALNPCLSETMEPAVDETEMDLPNDLSATQLMLQSQQLRDLANELAFDYLNYGDTENFSNLAKRDPGTDDTDNTEDSRYDAFVRRGIPPSLIKLTYGKRSNDKRYKNPFMFGKREDDIAKRAYSPFLFGKREVESSHLGEKRGRYSKFMFGKRGALDEDKRRSGYSALFFGKRVPEIAKRGTTSTLDFGKRGSHFSKFMFGKRDEDIFDADDGRQMEENFDKRGALTENKRFKPSFYLGKRNYVTDNDDVEDFQDV